MAELGIFAPSNPVTSYTPAQAVAATVTGLVEAGGVCKGIKPATGALPTGLDPKRFIRALACAPTGSITYRNHGEALVCGASYWHDNPWVECKTKRTLVLAPDGTPYLYESPCLTGFGATEYRLFDLEGNHVCSVFPPIPNPPNPNLPQAQPGAGFQQGLGVAGLGNPLGGLGKGGRPITVSGVNATDVGALLGGLGGTVDLSGLLGVLAALVVQGGNIRGSLDSLPGGVGDNLLPGIGQLAVALDSLVPGVGNRLANALTDHGNTVADEAAKIGANIVLSFIPGAGPIFNAATDAAAGTFRHLPELFQNAGHALVEKMLSVFRDHIEARAPVTPENVHQVAASAIAAALVAGLTAHLAALGLELLHPIKHMGVPQLVGLLAEFAGFTEIAKPFFGPTLRYGIGEPAEHRARAHFRSVLPPVETAREVAAAGLMGLQKYRERLTLAGFPDPYPAALADMVYTPPAARFLAQLLDGSESDRPWLAAKLRRLGFSPEDTARAVHALELKTTAPGRNKLVATLVTDYTQGRLGGADLDAGLVGAGLSVTHRAYYRRAADLDRRANRMEAVARAATTQYEQELVGPAEYRQILVALGFTDDEVTVRLTVGDLALHLKQVQAETKGLEAEIRALKAKGLASAGRQLRAGFLDLPHYLAVGQGMGYSRQLLEVAASLALLQGKPKTTADAAAIGAGALEETRTQVAALVAQEVQAKRTGRVVALASLRNVGLPTDLASTLVDLAEAIAGPGPLDGDFGFRTGSKVDSGFAAVLEAVLGGLAQLPAARQLLEQLVKALGLPAHDTAAVEQILQVLQGLFRRRG